MMTSTPKSVKSKKDQIDEMFVEGAEEVDPFTPIKKLFNGFCTPGKEKESTPKEASVAYGLSNGAKSAEDTPNTPNGHVNGVEEERDETEKADEHEESVEVTERGTPIVESQEVSKQTVKSGIEISMFSVLAIIATLFALYRLGFKIGAKGGGPGLDMDIAIGDEEDL